MCSVHADDKDSHLNQEITYLMATYSDTKAQEKFNVNSVTGAIFTIQELDREEQEVCLMKLIRRQR